MGSGDEWVSDRVGEEMGEWVAEWVGGKASE